MKNFNLKILLCSIGIILASLMMIYTTYAYFSVNVEGEGKDITLSTFDENTTIIYNDTSNVSMVNAYTGDKIVKTFSVENTSNYVLYYDIVLKNVVNNFENKEDLVYTLTSNAANRETSIIPSEEESLASEVLIMPHEKHEYTMTITFLKRNTDQSKNMNKTFSSNIHIEGSKTINVGESVYKDGTLLKEIIEKSNYEENNIKYTNNSTNGIKVYYYVGNPNNYLALNNMCFRIVRTDEDYGIRVIYNGEYTDGVCSENYISKSSFNLRSNYNAYVGYMYGNASSNNYNNEHNNINNSTIKTVLDNWYKEKFTSDSIINKNSIFCNSRTMSEFTLNRVLYSKNGYGASNTGYYNIDDYPMTYKCENVSDRFSVTNNNSNKSLKYPVGLLSVDEIRYSGQGSFLLNGSYWTQTPAYFNGSDAYNYVVSKNSITTSKVSVEYGVRPVLSLNRNTILESGDGSIESPYIVK